MPSWPFVDFDVVRFSVVVENILLPCSSSHAQLSLSRHVFSLCEGFSLFHCTRWKDLHSECKATFGLQDSSNRRRIVVETTTLRKTLEPELETFKYPFNLGELDP